MYIEGFDQWVKMNRSLTTPAGEWNKIVTEILRRVTQQNLEILEDNFSRLSDQLKRLSTVKRPEEFFNLQRDCINENLTAGVQTLQKIIFMTVENVQECAKIGSLAREQATSIIKAGEKAGKAHHHHKEKEK